MRDASLPHFFFFLFLTFQSSEAGEPSTLPAASLARTWKLCLPFLTWTVWGEVHGWKGPSSSLHSNVELGSVEVNSKVAVFFLVLSLGFLVIWVSGAAVSPSPPPPSGGGAGGTSSSAPMSGAAPTVLGSPSMSTAPSSVAAPVPASIVGEPAAWWKSPLAASTKDGGASWLLSVPGSVTESVAPGSSSVS